jgi:hypothetical protein
MTTATEGNQLLSTRERALLEENMSLKEELIPYRRGEKSWLFWMGFLTLAAVFCAAAYSFLRNGSC